MLDLKDINFYVVVNSDGKYFRKKGYMGTGDTWTDKFTVARVWVKLSGARSVVTFFANQYPQYPTPNVLKLSIGSVEVLDESERVAKAKAKKQKDLETRELRSKKHALDTAKKQFEDAKSKYEQEKQKVKTTK